MKYFACGEQGYLKRDCPKVEENKAIPANLNVVNTGDATPNNHVQGMISI